MITSNVPIIPKEKLRNCPYCNNSGDIEFSISDVDFDYDKGELDIDCKCGECYKEYSQRVLFTFQVINSYII